MGRDVSFAAGTHSTTVEEIKALRCAYWLSKGTYQTSTRIMQGDEKIEGPYQHWLLARYGGLDHHKNLTDTSL